MKRIFISPIAVLVLIMFPNASAFADAYYIDFSSVASLSSQKNKINQLNKMVGLPLTSEAFDTITRWQRNKDQMSAVANLKQVHYIRKQSTIDSPIR